MQEEGAHLRGGHFVEFSYNGNRFSAFVDELPDGANAVRFEDTGDARVRYIFDGLIREERA